MVVGTVGEVAGGVTLEVIMVGGGRAWVLVSEVLVVVVTCPVPRYCGGAESEAVEEVEGLCSCL